MNQAYATGTTPRGRFNFPRPTDRRPRGRLILPKPLPGTKAPSPPTPGAPTAPPAAYVPYAPPSLHTPTRRRVYPLIGDNGASMLGILSLVLTVSLCLPIGLILGPMALARAKGLRREIAEGRRHPAYANSASTARVTATMGIVLSVCYLVVIVGVLLLLARVSVA